MSALGIVARQPVLAGIALALLLLGGLNASVYPYQSLIAIERIGLSHTAYAGLMVLASAVAVTTSVLLGVLSDQRFDRRAVALFTAACGAVGIGAMAVAPGVWTLILCHGLMLPVHMSLYGQIFALSRLATGTMPRERDAIQSTVRSAMSLSFLGMMLFWTWAFAWGADVMSVYLTGSAVAVGLLVVIARVWPRDAEATWEDTPPALNLKAALAQIARPRILVRLVCMGSVATAGLLFMALASLVFEAAPGRGPEAMALYWGMVAGWEIPAMLVLPRWLNRLPRARMLLIGAAIYGTHLALMPALVATPLIWVLPVLAGLGGALLIIMPIGYYQDLMEGQPGIAGALMAVQRLMGDILAAGAFAIGMALDGPELTALAGTVMAVLGATALVMVDRRRG
jgi:SET family sugar efflux transporter-like MFS transporter